MRTELFKQDVMSEYKNHQCIIEFERICDEYYDQHYRMYGVEKFYEQEKDEIHSIAHEIIDRIETVVYNKWLCGELTANDVCDYVTMIKNYCDRRISYFREKIEECQKRLSEELQQDKEELLQRWNKMGWLHIALGLHKPIFEEYSHVKCESMIVSASICAYKFALQLVERVINEIEYLHEAISHFMEAITGFAVYADKRANAAMNEIGKKSDGLWRICKKGEFMDALDKYLGDTEVLMILSRSIREIFARHADTNNHSFRQLAYSVNEDVYEEAIDRCKKELYLYDSGDLRKISHKNIYSVLRKTVCSNDSDTEAFTKELLRRAKPLVTWNQDEIGRAYNFDSFYQEKIIMMPEAYDNGDKELHNKLIENLSSQVASFDDRKDVISGFRSMTLVSLVWGFPYSYVLPNKINNNNGNI